ncbi:fructosamine kinase family protein [Halomonas piscis]|uniref:Fructosamine kinase family protein n=1 Tax=Halomonas piscis TaxID=3031727 RepID=A0ABY9YX31_9GAMM|nr:fructosamine kinase family protein [Halomonas piscis]WNK19439.1 fructosamine kinase family protein [Halomonas piscis]
MEAGLRALLEEQGVKATETPRLISAGGNNAVYFLAIAEGELIAKSDAPEQLEGEADGLMALARAASGLIVPEVVGCGHGWLLTEALETAGGGDETALGEGLRRLHQTSFREHGWHRDNACGQTPQPNAPMADGRAFQRERRLLPLVAACARLELLDPETQRRIRRQAETLEDWLTPAAPRLVHGDLWAGNVLYTPRGPAMIDPAVYAHYPEVDLAMLTLFGAPGRAFFDAYWDGAAPADWPRREALFQLYPLLNHVLLFGTGYLGGVRRALSRLERAG